jgi:hypothetical protein
MAGMSISYLRASRASLVGRRLTVSYTVIMLFLTVGNYYTTAKFIEALIIEYPAGTPEASDAQSCAPINIVGTVLAILQALLSDALMV